jgi:hypothetical protein
VVGFFEPGDELIEILEQLSNDHIFKEHCIVELVV